MIVGLWGASSSYTEKSNTSWRDEGKAFEREEIMYAQLDWIKWVSGLVDSVKIESSFLLHVLYINIYI